MKEDNKKLIAVCCIAVVAVVAIILLWPNPKETESINVSFEGIMVMNDNETLSPYMYIEKWNVYGKLPDDYRSTAISALGILYENATDYIWVEGAYLNYQWDKGGQKNDIWPVINPSKCIIPANLTVIDFPDKEPCRIPIFLDEHKIFVNFILYGRSNLDDGYTLTE